jgi:hypothetical protein
VSGDGGLPTDRGGNMNADEPKDDPWKLATFWYEPPGDDKEQLEICCGEMLGSLNKLTFVRLELEETAEKEDLDTAYEYLDYHFENYLVRLYAMRERLVNALGLLRAIKISTKWKPKSKDWKQDSHALKTQKKRQQAASSFEAVAPKATKIAMELLDVMDDEIETRNMDTHNAFFHIWLYDGSNVWEPMDVLTDVRQKKERREIEARLRTLLRRFVEEHCKKIELIVEKIEAFTNAALDRPDPLGDEV